MFAANGQPRIDRNALAAKADEIDRVARRMRAVSRGLRHAASCPAATHTECPTFRRLMKAAAQGSFDPQRTRRDAFAAYRDK